MAFLDKISKTVTEAGQKTIAKTKELADTSRLNSLISEQEKIISNQYYQIGKLYVSLHKEDFESDFAGMISTIAEAEAKITDCRKQIQDIKGVQRCPECGGEVPSGAAFCNFCGAAMPKPEVAEEEERVKCEDCGAMVKKGMRFCTSCGRPMEAVVMPAANGMPAMGAPAMGAPAEKICTSCGTRVPGNMDYCTECGTKL